MEPTVSPSFSLNKTDLIKIGKGAIFALCGALLTYLAQTIPHIDFGSYTPIITALLAVAMNTAHKWLSANHYE